MTWHQDRIQFFLELVPSLGYTQVASVELHRTEKAGDIMVIMKVDSLRIVAGERLFLKRTVFTS